MARARWSRIITWNSGEGPGAGHGPQHEFQVMIRDTAHPITKSMPGLWLHRKDELYHGQRGPAADMEVLATAYSADFSKKVEPIVEHVHAQSL